jgi:carboxylate-amine ligase
VFDAPAPLTVGVEEEVMLLHPQTLDLAPRAREVLARLDRDLRYKLELPAAQLEIVTPPVASAAEAARILAAGRRALAGAAAGLARPAAAGVHPFTAPLGELDADAAYAHTRREYGPVARLQLVSALQVHVAVRGADRALAVYNALRSHLPALAALAANAPFLAGRDTGLQSVRPKIGELLPRQGVPPALASWEAYAEALRWGTASGFVPDAGRWWWELRPHPVHGTLEVRVPDAQCTVDDAAAVVAVVHALVAHLVERVDAGEQLPVAPSWRIDENRWSACRHGLDGAMADLGTGETGPTREHLRALLDALEPAAAALGCTAEIGHARALAAANGAARQRTVAAERGIPGVAGWLAEQFLA